MSRSRRAWSISIGILILQAAVILLVLLSQIRAADAFRLFRTDPTSQWETAYNEETDNHPPTDTPPFDHWDLRRFTGSKVPYSINLTGLSDVTSDSPPVWNATDEASATAAIRASFQSWEDVQPAINAIGSGYPAPGTYPLYVVQDETTWTPGMAIPARVAGTAAAIAVGAGGTIQSER